MFIIESGQVDFNSYWTGFFSLNLPFEMNLKKEDDSVIFFIKKWNPFFSLFPILLKEKELT